MVQGPVVHSPQRGTQLAGEEDLLLGEEGGAEVRDQPGGPPSLPLQRAVGGVRGVRGPRGHHGPGPGLSWPGGRMVSH